MLGYWNAFSNNSLPHHKTPRDLYPHSPSSCKECPLMLVINIFCVYFCSYYYHPCRGVGKREWLFSQITDGTLPQVATHDQGLDPPCQAGTRGSVFAEHSGSNCLRNSHYVFIKSFLCMTRHCYICKYSHYSGNKSNPGVIKKKNLLCSHSRFLTSSV